MDPFVDWFVITGCKTRAMVGSNKKADVLFAILMYCRTTDKDKKACMATIEEYFSDETEANTDNEEGMHTLNYSMIKQTCTRWSQLPLWPE